ncbi:MAG: Dabb family protein [Candidatus Marinimicrobia bacterium]|nr:Dabb family protein [Candidatus Neomarinimicrobiota bacterium]
MIKHIVMWKLKDENKAENASEMVARLAVLKNKIEEIKHIEAGVNINPAEVAYDVALYSEFENEVSLSNYQNHEAHQEVVKFIRSVTTSRVVVDYVC